MSAQPLFDSITETRADQTLDRLQHDAHSPRLEHRPSSPAFDGETFDSKLDEIRLNGQLAKVYNWMSDGNWRSLSELKNLAGGSEAGCSARLRDLRKPKYGSHIVNRRRRGDPRAGTFEYQLIVNHVR